MKEYLSIKEVADYLGVDYKTIYRLVQQAEIPAGKVGGVYRIPRQEVEAYYERQRQVLVRQASATLPIKCGRCLRLLAPYEIEGPCDGEECEEPICRTCWEADPDHRCRLHVRSREERLALARAQLQKGAIASLLTSDQAYQREILYLSRVEAKLREQTALPHPTTRRMLRVASWDVIETRVQQLDRIREATIDSMKDAVGPLPTNPRITYRVAKGLMLELLVYSDLAAHLRQGFVTEASSHTQLFEQLGQAMERAEKESSLVVLGLAATAGWETEASELIVGGRSGQRPFFHRLLAPVLVDLTSDRLTYNTTDQRLDGLAELYSAEMGIDVVQRVIDAAEALFDAGRSGVLMSELVEREKVSPSDVAEAFGRLAARGEYRVEEIDQRDRLLLRRSV